MKVRPAEVRSVKSGFAARSHLKVDFAEVGLTKIGLYEERFAKIGSTKVGACEVRPDQIGFLKIRFAEIGLQQIGSVETCLSEVRPLKVRPAENQLACLSPSSAIRSRLGGLSLSEHEAAFRVSDAKPTHCGAARGCAGRRAWICPSCQ
jgi:hypothetical protein